VHAEYLAVVHNTLERAKPQWRNERKDLLCPQFLLFIQSACYTTGNDNLNLLTSGKQYKLRIDMSTFDGRTSYAEYDNFNVSSSADNYRLVSIGTYTGTAGRLFEI